ncbi:chemotaxis protein CheW [Natrialba swarupiae]|uniref:Chemotaxis protein CheW n=1 Tax=Natrialba swarupiae TaxID=2448032 RepID=A0A5D5APV2_9EURY|nr:chemotaxis protein CheW [Natrialba swarupiae]TYT63063.1 chemotaxis protein CheW [Natrialba swarupiae]
MAPDLPEKLLGIDIGAAENRTQRESPDRAEEEQELLRFVLFGIGEHRLAVPVDDVRTITDVPDDLTRVPRTPRAIEGMMDLRGEITAVIDITDHFPVTEERPGREQLLVFDTSGDEQSAAARIDDVLSVDAIPERAVLSPDNVEQRGYSSEPLEHPLVDALLEREHRSTRRSRGDGSAQSTAEDVAPVAESITPTDRGGETGDDSESVRTTAQLVVDVIPLINVENLLAASGHLVSDRATDQG